MKRYSQYKDSGVEWIGEIPKHWSISKLAWSLDFETGFTPSTKNNSYYDNGTNVWVTISDMNKKNIGTSKVKITDEAVEGRKIVPEGSLLYSFKLSVGKMAFTGCDLYTNEAIFAIKPTSNIILEYYYYLLGEILEFNSNENIYGAKLLNQELIKASKILVPPVREQKAIASHLDTKTEQIDHLIQLKERKIELLKEKRQALINETVTKGLDPSVPMKDSGVEWIGEIPEHWGVKKMKYGLSLKTEKGEPMSDDIKISPENVQSYTGVCNNMHSEYSGDGVIFEKGDILFNKLRLYLAKIWFATLSGYSMGEMIVLSPNKITNGKYMFYQFFIQGFIDFLDAQSTGVKMPRVSPEVILNTLLCFPPSYEQEEIASYLNKQSKEIYSLIKDEKIKINLLKEYRQSLISEAVTGQIRVCEEDVSAHQTQNV